MEKLEEYLPITAEQAWLSMRELEAQFTDVDRRRRTTADAFWAKHPDSKHTAGNWCSPWDSTFNLWFRAVKIWERCIETKRSLLVGAELVRAIQARNDGEYCLFPADQLGEWEQVLEECTWETADPDIASRTQGLLEELRHAVEVVPGVESVAVGPSLLIEEVERAVAFCRMPYGSD